MHMLAWQPFDLLELISRGQWDTHERPCVRVAADAIDATQQVHSRYPA